MKKKIIIIVSIVAAVVAVADIAVLAMVGMLLLRTDVTAEDIVRNTVAGIFGTVQEFTLDEVPEKNTLNSITASLNVPSELTGTEENVLIDAEIRENIDKKSGLLSLSAKDGDNSIDFKVGLADGRFNLACVVNGSKRTSFYTGFDIAGCDAACDESWLNPEVNPDSPFDSETYMAYRNVFTELEKRYNRIGQEDTEDPELAEYEEKLGELIEKLAKLPKSNVEKERKLFGNPAITVEWEIGPEEISEAIRLILEFTEDTDEEETSDAAVGTGDAEATDAEATDTEATETKETGSETDSDTDTEAGSESETAPESLDIGKLVDELKEALEKAGISVKAVVKITENRIDSLEITVEYKEFPEEDEGAGEYELLSAETEREEPEATAVKLALNISFDYESKKISCDASVAENGEKTTELSAALRAENSGTSLKLSLEAEGKTSEEDLGKITAEVEYATDGNNLNITLDGSVESPLFEAQKLNLGLSYEKNGEWTLKTDGTEFASGILKTDASSVEFTVDSLVIPYTYAYFVYGDGLYTESRTVTAENLLSVSGEISDAEIETVKRGTDFFLLKKSVFTGMTKNNGIIYEAIAAVQEATAYAEPSTLKTSDGVTVTEADPAEARSKEILNAYLNYVNNTLGKNAFTAESAYVWLFDDVSRLYYVIDASSGTAYIYLYTQVSEEIAQLYHPVSMHGAKMTVHTFSVETPDVTCGEKFYTLYTCSQCGLQLISYTGKTREHTYVEKKVQVPCMTRPGQYTNATANECTYCGRLIVNVHEDFYSIEYSKNEDGYTAESVTPSALSKDPRSVAVALPKEYSEKVTAIGDGFINDSSYNRIYGIYIAEGVKTIGENAFSLANSLRDVMLPASLESIGDGAFTGCINLNKIFYCGTEDGWKKVVKGDGEALLSGVCVCCNSEPTAEYMCKNDLTFSQYQTVNKNITNLRTKSLTSMQTAGGTVSGVSYIAPNGTNKISGIAVDDKTGNVAVCDKSGNVSVYSSSGKYIGDIPKTDCGVSAGEGYIVIASSNWIAAYDADTLKEIFKFETGLYDYITNFKSQTVYNGVIYAMASSGFTAINMLSGSSEAELLMKISGSNHNMITDRENGLIYIVCRRTNNVATQNKYETYNANVYIYHTDTGKFEESSAYYGYYAGLDGNGICSFSYDDEYSKQYMLKFGGTYYEVDNGVPYVNLHFGLTGTNASDGTGIYGNIIMSAASLDSAEGYTPYRYMYRDSESQVYVGYGSSYKVCTVIKYKGKTKLIPVAADNVISAGSGVFVLWSDGATQAAIIDMNK